MSEDELRPVIRDFKASVSADLARQDRRLSAFADEMRQRIGAMETAVVNEIRDLSERVDGRLARIEVRLDSIGG